MYLYPTYVNIAISHHVYVGKLTGLLVQLAIGILAVYLDIPAAFLVISRVLTFVFELLAAFGAFYWRRYIRSELI